MAVGTGNHYEDVPYKGVDADVKVLTQAVSRCAIGQSGTLGLGEAPAACACASSRRR
jgi:hypothetical protein